MSTQKKRTGLAVASLILGILGLPCAGFFGLGALAGLILGITALVKAKNEPAVYGGSGMAIGGIVTSGLGLLLIPIIAAMLIPSLITSQTRNSEIRAIGDIRTVISAEAVYASENGGYYDTLECLAAPTSCLPDYPEEAPYFLDRDFVSIPTRSGYERIFYPGPVAEAGPDETISPSSIISFAYVTVPVQPGKTGKRAFCGDQDGRLCATMDGEMPAILDGACPESCSPLH